MNHSDIPKPNSEKDERSHHDTEETATKQNPSSIAESDGAETAVGETAAQNAVIEGAAEESLAAGAPVVQPEQPTPPPADYVQNDSEGGMAVVYASQKKTTDETKKSKVDIGAATSKLKGKPAILAAVAVAAILVVFLILGAVGKSSLKADLTRTWHATDGTILQVLEVSDDEMEYSLQTGYSWLDSSLATWEWKPVSSTSFKVKIAGETWVTHEVEFSDDGDAMIVRPALTSSDASEVWVDIS